MKIIYLDCSMGAAGDMLSSALYELVDNKKAFLDKVNSIGIPNTVVAAEKAVKCGIAGTHLTVKVNGAEEGKSSASFCSSSHRSLADIENIVNAFNTTERIKNDIISVYKIIAFAESKVHNADAGEIHFHELGAFDALADITMFSVLTDMLGADKIMASAVNTGSGRIRCAHGILPVPAPAAAEILKGIPVYSNEIKAELCTPTGAAILKYFVKDFNNMPEMIVDKIGYGMGTKDFEEANCIRAFYGSCKEGGIDRVFVLQCNIDDMTAEDIAFAAEIFIDEGALDVYSTPVVMKKGRPAIMLSAICRADDKDKFVKLIFKHTSTLGIRESLNSRYVLSRANEAVLTPYGRVRLKKSFGYGVQKEKYEYDDISKIAKENGLSLNDVKSLIDKSKD